MGRLGASSHANTSLIGVLVGLSVFTVSLTAIVQVSTDDANKDDGASDRSELEVGANSLADLLLSDPGAGWYSGAACTGSKLNEDAFKPDKVVRIGLAEEPCANPSEPGKRVGNLSFAKLSNLQKAKLTKDASNGALDYDEARTLLGYGADSTDFHLRSYPVLDDVRTRIEKGYRDPHVRPLLIADYTSTPGGPPGPKAVQHSKGITNDDPDTATVWVNITNNGLVAVPFSVLFKVDLKSGNVDFTLHTPVLAVGAYYNVTYTIRKTADWTWNDATKKYWTYEIIDKDGGFHQGQIDVPFAMTHTQTRLNFIAEAEKLWYKKTDATIATKWYYEAWDGKGQVNTNFADWTYRVTNLAGAPTYETVLPNAKKGDVTHNLATAELWTGRLSRDAPNTGQVWNQDRTNVLAADPLPFTPAPAGYTHTPMTSALAEIAYLDTLTGNFEPKAHSTEYGSLLVPYGPGGDVYPDDKKSLTDDLYAALTDGQGKATTAKHDIVVIGTGVDQKEMTAAAIKKTIEDWVLAGGMLIVFGTDAGHDNWLQSVYKAKLQAAPTGDVQETDHPILRTPNHLDATAYDPHGLTWTWSDPSTKDLFTHAVTLGADDVLAVSKPGALGDGRVALTSWWPHDPLKGAIPTECLPATLTAECAGLLILDNLLTFGYSELYVDYGPPIPSEATQGSQGRIVSVWQPQMQRRVDLQFTVYVWE